MTDLTTLAATVDEAFERRADITAKTRRAVAAAGHRGEHRAARHRQGARRREEGRRVGRQPVAEEGRAALLPHARQHSHGRRLHALLRQGAAQVRASFEGRRRRRRVVPPAIVRRGSYVAPNVVLMPSYVNIGAYVDSGTMVDTWATVGSCAQIGKNVHLSGGVGIGGVLEPLQAAPDDHRGQLLHRRALGSRRRRRSSRKVR